MQIQTRIKSRLKAAISKCGYSIARVDELTRLADHFGSDKGSRSSAHFYTRIYSKIFEPIRNDKLTILEIGLLRADVDRRRVSNASEGATAIAATRAPSLEMWRAYFPKASIFGFDIDDFSRVNIDGCSIICGDMSSKDDLEALVRAINSPIDIIVEDGSHVSHHQQIALGFLFQFVRAGGMYIIEDIHWQDDQIEKKDAPKTRDILRRFQIDRIVESPFLSVDQRKYLEEHVDRVWLFDSLTQEVDDSTDALAILCKK
jgi:hypothetical protein